MKKLMIVVAMLGFVAGSVGCAQNADDGSGGGETAASGEAQQSAPKEGS